MPRFLITTCLMLGFLIPGFGQRVFTDQWIDFDKTYYRIPVAKDGIFRVMKSDLKAAGMAVDGVSDNNYHMYHNGQEVRLFITGDYIEFYGEKAKGDLDVKLYEDLNSRAHAEHSIYTDSSYYYITHEPGSNGLRFQTVTNTNLSGLSVVNTHERQRFITFSTSFQRGVRPSGSLYHPDMGYGEGWVSNLIDRKTPLVNSVDVSDLKPGSNINLRTEVNGENDQGANRTRDNLNQHFVFETYNGTWNLQEEKYFRGYTHHEISFELNESDLNNGELTFQIRSDQSYKTEKNPFRGIFTVPHVQLNYTANCMLTDGKTGLFSIEKSGVDRAIEITNFVGTQALVYDIGNGKLLDIVKSGSTLKFRADKGSVDHKFAVADGSDIETLKPLKRKFNRVSVPAGTNFLIISNKTLKSSATEYAQFRRSVTGGNYKVELVFVEDLYNQYLYGYHHPVAIKNLFMQLMDNNQNPEHVFIIGKGIDPQFLKNRDDVFDYTQDLVPSIGSPSADWYYLRGVSQTSILPPFAISRLSASDNETVRTYLEKVRTYSSLSNEKWRKNVVMVSGGKETNEIERFKGYSEELEKIIVQPKMGSNVYYFGKESGLQLDEGLTEKILTRINEGAGFFSYFGHAGSNVTEVDLSIPINYHNSNSPLVMYFGGCVLGSCYETTPLLGEQFIGARTGAVAWIAAGSFSFEPIVYEYTRDFYFNMSQQGYGQSVGKIVQATIEQFYKEGDLYKEAQAWLTLIQGDPAITIYSPELPDYEIKNNDIFITPENVTAQSDSFYSNIVLSNHGKAIQDTLMVAYRIATPGGAFISDTVEMPAVFNIDTFVFVVKNNSKEFGTYRISITIDPENEIKELNEENNEASYSFTLLSNGATGLFPPNYGIVNEYEIELVGQSLDITSSDNIYLFEMDTTPTFKSPWRKQSGELKSGFVGSWKVKLLPNDSQDYYWRIRLKLPDGTTSNWSQKSFSFIENSLEGWAQIDFKQIVNSTAVDIYGDTASRKFRFLRSTQPGAFTVQNHGRDYPNVDNYVFGKKSKINDEKLIRLNNYRDQVDGNRCYNGMMCYVISPYLNSNDLFDYWEIDIGQSSASSSTLTSGIFFRNGGYRFNWMTTEEQIDPVIIDSFISFLHQVPEGYHIMMYSGYYHRISDMPDRFYQAVEKFGSAKIRQVKKDGVWLMIGTKGYPPGLAHDEQLTTDQDVVIAGSTRFTVTKFNGSYKSSIIGPSRKWRKLHVSTTRFNDESADVDNKYVIWGIDSVGNRIPLVDDFRENDLDLTFIDPNRFPFIQLELLTRDQSLFEPANPKRWVVNYDYLPEGLMNAELAYAFNSDTLERGKDLEFEIGYQNVSKLSLEDFIVTYEILDKDRNQKTFFKDTIKPLAPGESTVIRKTFSSNDLINENRLVVRTNPDFDQPELYSFNNNFERQFYVQGDYERPIMEVSFDGIRILNGDIVSPEAVISITGKDNNEYFLLDNPEYFKIYLEKPGNVIPIEITKDSAGFTFFPATEANRTAKIEYAPASLPDGEYVLNVQLSDASGNESGVTEYTVNFEVVGKSTISHFYTYPNPFSTEMRFVFTLTGSEMPDDIVVQIMTVSGKVVREITKQELGDLKIGQNVSQFSWNGTDMYGNKLANGVYLYRVKTVLNGQQIERRASNEAADDSFKEDFGKIYILR